MRDFALPGLGLGYYQMVTAMTAWCVSAMNMDFGVDEEREESQH